MSSKRAWVWTGRLAALVAAVVIPACGSTGTSGLNNANGIFWNSPGTGTPMGGTPGGGTGLWVDPNTGLGASQIGISNIVVSTDDATYDSFSPTGTVGVGSIHTTVQYVRGNLHPLSTDTGSTSITSRESTLEGLINGYRQQQLGNVGGGGINGGIAVGNVTGIILAGHFEATKSARAHCKYFALGYGGNLAFAPGPNTEGDDMQTTNLNSDYQNGFMNPVPPTSIGNAYGSGSTITDPFNYKNPNGDQGRLGKIDVIAYLPTFAMADFCVSGQQYGEADAVMSYLLRNFPADIAVTGPTNLAVGHWRGGSQQAYWWDIILLLNPTPAN
jgi:hypothetical protein